MASSRGTSNGPDWKDVTQAILNYEKFNACAVEVAITARSGKKTADLVIVASAHGSWHEGGEVLRLGLASVSCQQEGYALLEAAIMKALFDLDVILWSNALGIEVKHG